MDYWGIPNEKKLKQFKDYIIQNNKEYEKILFNFIVKKHKAGNLPLNNSLSSALLDLFNYNKDIISFLINDLFPSARANKNKEEQRDYNYGIENFLTLLPEKIRFSKPIATKLIIMYHDIFTLPTPIRNLLPLTIQKAMLPLLITTGHISFNEAHELDSNITMDGMNKAYRDFNRLGWAEKEQIKNKGDLRNFLK